MIKDLYEGLCTRRIYKVKTAIIINSPQVDKVVSFGNIYLPSDDI